MKKILYALLIMWMFPINAQNSLKDLLKKYNTERVPYITVDELKKETSDIVLLDARELKEFNVSHISNAICVGYDNFNLEEAKSYIKNKNTKIIVYCSLGIRSEDIAEKLLEAGYHNILNLYGGIFEWKNQQNIVVDTTNQHTEKVHTFNKEWSKWLVKGEKVY